MDYKYSVPMMNLTVNEATRDEYLRMMKSSGVERVFLAICELWYDRESTEKNITTLRDNIAFFRKNGIEAAIWVGMTVGHGAVLSHETVGQKYTDYKPMVNFDGTVIGDTRCPSDPVFRAHLAEFIVRLARETDAKLILLDDDFRISQHGKGFCCACDAHIDMICRECGEALTREELKKRIFESPSNKYRAAYLKAMGDSLRAAAAEMREAMDEFDPSVCIALCSASCSWDVDGATAVELTKILAGRNKPLLRLTGAPYWAVVDPNKPLSFVLETARMLRSVCENEEMELIAEGDVYPRPRYIVPAAHLEIYDSVMRCSGYDGILKYMIDYNTTPWYEPSYIKHHLRNLPLHEKMGDLLRGKRPSGVRVFVAPRLVPDADYTLSAPTYYSPTPTAGTMLQSCGIPTFYGEGDCCATAIFGENARHISDELLKGRIVIDAVAAAILSERGIDVGLAEKVSFVERAPSFVETVDEPGICVVRSTGRYLDSSLSEKISVKAWVRAGEERRPLVYSYDDGSGRIFTVLCVDGLSLAKNSGILRGYAIQRILIEACGALPAVCPNAPELFTLCAREGDSLSVGLFNCFADKVLDPVIKLDRAYSSASFVNCSGRIDGDSLILSDIPAFGFVGFTVSD